MQIGLGRLGLTPAAFWAMSLAEWRCACEGLSERLGAAEPMTRADLERLMADFPDTRETRP